MGRDGLVISLREAGFFASGSATPKPQTLDTLRQIAASLSHTPYDLRIEGHTDNVPIHNAEFDSNWELSTARATSIARILLDLKAIPADRLSAAGYAEFHPVATNDTAEGRAQNRRVDLVVLPRSKINFSQPDSSPASRRMAQNHRQSIRRRCSNHRFSFIATPSQSPFAVESPGLHLNAASQASKMMGRDSGCASVPQDVDCASLQLGEKHNGTDEDIQSGTGREHVPQHLRCAVRRL